MPSQILPHDAPSGATPRPAAPPIPTQLPLLLVQFPEDSQWVRLRAGARAPIPGVLWGNARPTYPELREHVDGGGNGGVVPASADWREGIRLAVLDVDRGDAAALTGAYPPVATARTARGAHAWYLSDDPPAVNAQWSGPGGTGGDYRGLNGYAALHGDELAVVDAGLARMGRAGRGRGELPLQLLDFDRDRLRERSVRRVVAHVAAALGLFEVALPGATAHPLRDAPVGGRHPALVRAMAFWGGRRHTNDGRRVDDDWLAGRCASYWLGLPNRTTFSEVEAAGILAWVLAARRRWHAQPHKASWLAKQAERGRKGGGLSHGGGRPLLFDRPMTAAERKRRQRSGVTKQANGLSAPGAFRLV